MIAHKRRDGFLGQRMIMLPPQLLKSAIKQNPLLSQLYISQIGYFPKASFHYRERRNGCSDNILIYCQQGKGWYVLGKDYYEVKANEYVILPAGSRYMRYGADEQDPWTILWVHFSGSMIKELNQLFAISNSRGARPISFNEKIIETWETMYRSLEMGYTVPNICNANFLLYPFIASFLFSELHFSGTPDLLSTKDVLVAETIADMKLNLNQTLTVSEMAARQSISASYLTQIFKSVTGRSPMDYFIQLKMQVACKLLHNSNMKIKNVALEIGYQDPYYFSRIFKKYMTMSPELYREVGWKEMGLKE
jgi:AraC-like DNA-binding protein